MTKVNFLGMIAAIIFLSAFTISNSTTWEIAEGYSIEFSSKDPSGVFTKLAGDIEFDEANLSASKFDVKIDVASINTGNGMKNKHAKSKNGLMQNNTLPSILLPKNLQKQQQATK